ncbi:unnamed protein product [Symbiodinium necroappetens]|uniref:Uncharacterized protein n=1 Tax=Symbiodinium necroappetens TaxID=1628268 RepID=A0A812LYE7_9DINO|nr:unnamed protein product [Symbiodinium necroappetens]
MNDFREHDSKMFGMHGKYGSLNVAELSQADLRVTFRDHLTKQPIILAVLAADHVAMTFYDIDQGPSSMGIEEVAPVEVEGDWTLALVRKLLVHITGHFAGGEGQDKGTVARTLGGLRELGC